MPYVFVPSWRVLGVKEGFQPGAMKVVPNKAVKYVSAHECSDRNPNYGDSKS